MCKEVLDFKAHVDRKDLASWAQALFNQVNLLMIENQELREKVDHLEDLLKHKPIIVGEKREL